MRRRWEQAKAGEGQIVLISGEPGIGKSRLSTAIGSNRRPPHTRLRYFCSPHHQDSALYPFIAQLERAAGFAQGATTEEKLVKLERLIAAGTTDRDDITLIAELLSLPNQAASLYLSPERKREKLFESVLHQLQSVSLTHPVLFVFEDAQWADPSSRELLNVAIDRIRRLPVLLLLTFRPDFRPPWSEQPHVTTLELAPLAARHVAGLVHELSRNTPLPNDIVEEIVERTDGVPLFVEELTKAVLEVAGEGNRFATALASSCQRWYSGNAPWCADSAARSAWSSSPGRSRRSAL